MSRGKTHYRIAINKPVACGDKREVLSTRYVELVTCKRKGCKRK